MPRSAAGYAMLSALLIFAGLRRLERAGRIVLPLPRRGGGRGTVARREVAVAEPVGLPASAGGVEGLGPVRVDGSEHPLSARLHVGRQLRGLIRPSVCVRYLASRVLGMAARRVVGDFAAAYGIRPVLAETFVAPEYRGSCFPAAG